MITVLILIETMRDTASNFGQLTRANLTDRAKAPGAVAMHLYQDEKNPTKFTLLEVFDSQETIDAYYQTHAYKAWHDEVSPLVLSWHGSDQINLLDPVEASTDR